MFKTVGAALSAAAVTLALSVTVRPSASASSEPKVPAIIITPASCTVKENIVTIENFDDTDPNKAQHRFVVSLEGADKPLKQLNGIERTALFVRTCVCRENRRREC